MKKLFIVAITLVLAACTDEPNAVRVLHSAGYTDIVTKGFTPFGCGDDDTYHTEFTAKGPTGIITNGVVCSGVLKGSTIRIN